MKVYYAGEGSDELGAWAGDPAYRPRLDDKAAPTAGVLQTLFERYCPNAALVDACEWKHVRKYKAGNHNAPETRNVLGLALRASELGCDALVFVRDRDGYPDREADIESGVEQATVRFGIAIVGGTANEEIEAWLLALLGEHRAESRAKAKPVLASRHGISHRDAKVAIVREAELPKVANDCESFGRWRKRAEAAVTANTDRED